MSICLPHCRRRRQRQLSLPLLQDMSTSDCRKCRTTRKSRTSSCSSTPTTSTSLPPPPLIWLLLVTLVLWPSLLTTKSMADIVVQQSDTVADDEESINRLVINVQNDGQEVYQEVITSNISDDLIILDMDDTDGSYITQFIDFKSEVQIFRIYRLGEQDLNESVYKVYCFVTHLPKNEFISTDAMSKLRQRNPGAIRQAEDDKGKELYEMDLQIVVNKSSIISKHLPKVCSEATNSTFTREIDLRFWANTEVLNRDIISLTSSVHKTMTSSSSSATTTTTKRLHDAVQSCIIHSSSVGDGGNGSDNTQIFRGQPCLCRLQICVMWYPCALKYCKNKDNNNNNNNKIQTYRCGIKTCRKCRDFQFLTHLRQDCMWD
ncbi:out at first protein-like [Oppia nitens]|uniref:out at first protein-like n=1 Tax=Oppia nitens TaxID=1686743 RepID=UPI0023D9B3B9|nr:out at first protein-like [Oppia nitens]